MTAPRDRTRLFVYGTLLRGEPAHRMLDGALFHGAVATEPAYELVVLGAYPALVPGGHTAVECEVYGIEPAWLAVLDDYEGHPDFFRRAHVRLQGGLLAQAYLLRPEQVCGRPRILAGSWRAHRRSATPLA